LASIRHNVIVFGLGLVTLSLTSTFLPKYCPRPNAEVEAKFGLEALPSTPRPRSRPKVEN